MRTCRTVSCGVLLGALGSLACASAPPAWVGLSPSDTYAEAVSALEEGDHAGGRAELFRVLEVCGTSALGERAAVALMADALDPRHPDLDLSASLSHSYLSQPYRTPWAERVATSTYLVSLNLGGSVDTSATILRSADPGEFPAECGGDSPSPTWREPAPIPELSAQSVAGRLRELERSVEALEVELARVRETLRP